MICRARARAHPERELTALGPRADCDYSATPPPFRKCALRMRAASRAMASDGALFDAGWINLINRQIARFIINDHRSYRVSCIGSVR